MRQETREQSVCHAVGKSRGVPTKDVTDLGPAAEFCVTSTVFVYQCEPVPVVLTSPHSLPLTLSYFQCFWLRKYWKLPTSHRDGPQQGLLPCGVPWA